MGTEQDDSREDDGIHTIWDHTEEGGWEQVPFDSDAAEEE